MKVQGRFFENDKEVRTEVFDSICSLEYSFKLLPVEVNKVIAETKYKPPVIFRRVVRRFVRCPE